MARKDKLLYYIENRGEASVSELMEVAGACSKMTLWRDLKSLEKDGHIRRVHGGAVIAREKQNVTVDAYNTRENSNHQGKLLIAQEARAFVTEGKSLYFDSGTTIMELVDAIEPGRYTIITPGANTAVKLSQFTDSIIIGLGGQLNPLTLTFTGSYTEHFLEDISIDTAFISAPGFSENGFSMSSINERSIKKSAIRKANRVVMLIDSTKVGVICPFEFAAWSDIDYLITDRRLPAEYESIAGENNVTIIYPTDK